MSVFIHLFPSFHSSLFRGNKIQFKNIAAIKAKIGAAILQLDELQLEEPDSASNRYKALADVKSDLEAAKDLVDGRLDLIEKVDSSKVGWLAAATYEKSNGPVKKADSAKLWAEAEKSVSQSEFKRREAPRPFRNEPAQAGKDFNSRSRGVYLIFALLFLALCFLAPFPAGLCIHCCLLRRSVEEIRFL